ncbi:hypothetical protein H8356DRAFT_1318767 [Neocallimastix lanati (nom. inval.)]|nr:hypothetical protein H8356DRAFT_1318767 [Neocallimastix sp. JGI-2020a]
MSLTVKWNDKPYNVRFNQKSDDKGPWTNYVTVYDLKKKCNELTNIPMNRIKLLHAGETLNDDNASLTRYGIKNDSNILLMENSQSEANAGFYPMPNPNNNYSSNYPTPPPAYGYPPPGYGYPPPPPQAYGYPSQGYGYPPPPPQAYGYPSQGYHYPPPPPPQSYGYPSQGYNYPAAAPPPPHQGYNYPPPPDAAFLSSPSQNPSQTIRIPNGEYVAQAPPQAPGAAPGSAPGAAPPYGGLYPNLDPHTTSGSASPIPSGGRTPISKDEQTKQAKEQPLLFLNNCISETHEELEPLVNIYAEKVKRHPPGKPITKDLNQTYMRASELLMQKLLLIDMVMAGENEEIRMRRKTAVKLIQGLIDRVDALKSELNAKISK